MSVVLFSNNERMRQIRARGGAGFGGIQGVSGGVWVPLAEAGPLGLRAVRDVPFHGNLCVLFKSSSLEVLVAGRDLIHAGWKLLHHPLYGNYRPHQQPYRSLLLRNGANGLSAPDEISLHLIEEALNIYTSVPVLHPDNAPSVFLEDCSMLDFELMRLPLEQAGCFDEDAVWLEAWPGVAG